MSPIIVIPAQLTLGQEEDGPASACRQAYIDSIYKAGGTPILVPLGLSETNWQQSYDLADGILLSGGSDLDPALYNESPHPKLGKIIPERDKIESWFVKKAFEDNKPTLGICRGIQIMNAALGGTLYQDLPDQFSSEISHSSKGDDRWEHLSHNLEIDPSSKLASILPQPSTCAINSLHHQAIKDLAPGLKASAKSPDGLIEAAEGINKKFFVGIQCHPEALWQNVDHSWIKLFESFIAACRQI